MKGLLDVFFLRNRDPAISSKPLLNAPQGQKSVSRGRATSGLVMCR